MKSAYRPSAVLAKDRAWSRATYVFVFVLLLVVVFMRYCLSVV